MLRVLRGRQKAAEAERKEKEEEVRRRAAEEANHQIATQESAKTKAEEAALQAGCRDARGRTPAGAELGEPGSRLRDGG